MSNISLTKNGVAILRNGQNNVPVDVQILNLEAIKSAGTARYRLNLSDGEEIISGILEQQLNPLVENGEIKAKIVVRVHSSQSKSIKDGAKVIVIYQMDKLTDALPGNIGNPQKPQKPVGGAPQVNRPAANDSIYTPIKRLHPYSGNSGKWTIKATVTAKPDQMKQWSKDGREGVLFSVDLQDNDGGEIRATLFNDVAHKFWDVLQKDRTFLISKAKVKGANKKFSSLNSEYELNFDENTTCVPAGDDEQIQIHFDFQPLAKIEEMGKDSVVDVLAIVKETQSVGSLVSKATNRELRKRNVVLLDDNALTIHLTLWDEKADNPGWSEDEHPVLAIKGCKVSDFNGKTLSLPKNARMEIDPPLDAAQSLRNWYNAQGGDIKTRDLSSGSSSNSKGEYGDGNKVSYKKCSIADIVSPGYFEIKAYIISVSDKNPFYPSCKVCKRKVENDSDGNWFCQKCNSIVGCVYNYILNFMVADQTSSKFVSVFGDLGTAILGQSADTMALTRDSDPESFNNTLKAACYGQWRLWVKAEINAQSENNDLRFRANRMERIASSDTFKKETEILLNDLSLAL